MEVRDETCPHRLGYHDRDCCGQTKFVPLSIDSKSGSSAAQPCVDAYSIIKPLVFTYPHPDSWTWIIACDERSWQALVRHLGHDTTGVYTMALTDQKDHITYVRADAILHPQMGPASEPEHIIAHELAHIYLKSDDERAVDDLAWRWSASSSVPPVEEAHNSSSNSSH